MPTPDTIPPWLQGEDLTFVRFQGCARAAGGVLTPGVALGVSDFDVTLTLKSIRLSNNVERRDVRPVNHRPINEVITGEGTSLVVVEILKNNESVLKNFCTTLARSFDYIRGTFTRGPNTFVGIFVRGNLQDGVMDHGENTCEWNLGPCDPGNPQVAYTTP